MSGENVRGRRLDAAAVTATAVAAAGVAVGGWTLVADATTRAAANRWTAITGAVLAYEVGFLALHLDAGRPGAAVAPPNLVTLGRGLLYAATAGFLVVPPTTPAVRWAPAACYGTGVALDFADGRLARRTGRTTPLGAKLDHAFDTLGFLVAPLVGVAWGRLPPIYLSLSAARYVYLLGVGWRRRRDRPVGDLPESRVRRPLAALQMGFITVALAPVVPASIVHPASLVALAPSLATFVRDYVAVTGRLGETGGSMK
ncbi:CDP-alcohol phosphatidyltransferase family protein [Haloplanus pelagicus]|uniref:CDP-alcohol phosphatidyltransferase family protein n=1 Tax=Haloplanus pelagicus TaxID=2949995 RepID=UPI00203E97A9|nr:CDP-alcohol phosphatidyltransferase family protein [Haloplanus sp. HW8-1]